jgi:hypothetical protein
MTDIGQFIIDITQIQADLSKIVDMHVEVTGMAKTRKIHAIDIVAVLGH